MNVRLAAKAETSKPIERRVIETDGQTCAVRFSPCGRFLIAGGYDGRVHRWDATAEDWRRLAPLEGQHGWVQALAFAPEEEWLFTADSWGELRSWSYAAEVPTCRWTVSAAHDGWIRALAVSPDGSKLASSGRDGKIRLWSPGDGGPGQIFDAQEDVYAIAFHPDGTSLVSGDLKGRVQQWDLASGRAVRELDAGVLYKLDRIQDLGGLLVIGFDATGETLICAGSQPASGATMQGTPTILIFDWESGTLARTMTYGQPKDGYVCDLALTAEGVVMAVTSGTPGNGAFFFQRRDEDKPFFVSTKMANCHSLALHPDGRRLVVAATNRNSNGNGRRLGKDGEYPNNTSPLHVFELTVPVES